MSSGVYRGSDCLVENTPQACVSQRVFTVEMWDLRCKGHFILNGICVQEIYKKISKN